MTERGKESYSNREGREDNGSISMFGIVKSKRNIVSYMGVVNTVIACWVVGRYEIS